MIDELLQEDKKNKQLINQIKEKKIQQVLSVNEMQQTVKKKEILTKLEIKEDNVKFP